MFWKAPADPASHDPRGCPSYVREYIDPVVAIIKAEAGGAAPAEVAPAAGAAAAGAAAGPAPGAVRTADDLKPARLFSEKRHIPHPNIVHPPATLKLVNT
jgi:hypothetical protein